LQSGFAGSTCWVGWVITFPIFSSTRFGSNSESVGSWINSPDQAGLQNYETDEMGLAPFYLLHIFFSTFLSSNNISSQEALFWCPLELYYLKELSSSNENELMRAVEIIDVAYKLGILHSSSHILFPYRKISWERHAVNFICNKVCIEPVYPEIHLWVIYANLA